MFKVKVGAQQEYSIHKDLNTSHRNVHARMYRMHNKNSSLINGCDVVNKFGAK
jgi:hypothetical protein